MRSRNPVKLYRSTNPSPKASTQESSSEKTNGTSRTAP